MEGVTRRYKNVEIQWIKHAHPELYIYEAQGGQFLEPVDLAPLTFEQLHTMMINKGFEINGGPQAPAADQQKKAATITDSSNLNKEDKIEANRAPAQQKSLDAKALRGAPFDKQANQLNSLQSNTVNTVNALVTTNEALVTKGAEPLHNNSSRSLDDHQAKESVHLSGPGSISSTNSESKPLDTPEPTEPCVLCKAEMEGGVAFQSIFPFNASLQEAMQLSFSVVPKVLEWIGAGSIFVLCLVGLRWKCTSQGSVKDRSHIL